MHFRVGHAAGGQFVSHFELGTHRPATRFGGALKVGDPQEYMPPFAGTYAHPALAMGANQFISTHDRYLNAEFILAVCEKNRLAASVLAAQVSVFFDLMCFIAELLLLTLAFIHNE